MILCCSHNGSIELLLELGTFNAGASSSDHNLVFLFHEPFELVDLKADLRFRNRWKTRYRITGIVW